MKRTVRDVIGAELLENIAAVRALATAPSMANTSVSMSGIASSTPCSTRTPRMRPLRSTTAMIASSLEVAPAARHSSVSTSFAVSSGAAKSKSLLPSDSGAWADCAAYPPP